ncbi:UDP-glucose/GDP-mannose dehydrogenase family protein [Clostridiaceae bacterium]|jgi:UDPglucose 6-dehydrogenase|nr:UDP-glucose/GDP-mannose dehydrogenase family protein [Clostridium sp.]NBI72275.1 UDP-glucose/GDP-mannose dehydrogenase family protein [Clostridiaceae bacterium]
MRIAVIGTGYVGLVTGACFSEMGNKIWCVDVDEKKIENLNQGIIPIFEPGLADMVARNQKQGHLRFTTDLEEALAQCEICFIAVGTPMGEDGSADLQYVTAVAKDIGRFMARHMYVVDKSTVPVGTAEAVREAIQGELDRRGSDLTFDVISNPEFLKEGSAVSDCLKPDRIVIGADNEDAADLMKELYKPYVMNTENFIVMDVASAEMTKYAANCMLATKISFMNEISNICERVGADVNKVRMGIGSDKRIGYSFIYPGCGYGGSCFPKDVKALIRTAGQYGYHTRLLQAVEDVNHAQKRVLVEKITGRFGEDLSGKCFAIWGLAFKPDTDDMREAAALTIISGLTAAGAAVQVYDPKAMPDAKAFYLKGNDRVTYCDTKYEALKGADALVLVTEWKEFRSPDFYEIKAQLREPVIFDGRNQYSPKRIARYGLEYYQIGARPVIGREEP